MEQTVSTVKAGLMMGMFRLTEGEKTLVLELITFRQVGDGVEMRFRHFGADMAAWEKGDEVVNRSEIEGKDGPRVIQATLKRVR